MSRRAVILLVAGIAVHAVFLGSLVSPGHYLNPLFVEGTHNIGEGQGSDFYAFYQAGRYVLEGRDIYTRPMEDPERVVPYAYFYRYRPFVAYTIGVALNAVPPRAAYWLWVALCEAVLALCVLATRRAVRNDELFSCLAFMWLAYSPLYIEQYMGQFNLIMAALIFATALGHARGRSVLMDWSWIASVVLKHLTILFVPLFLRMRRFRPMIIGGVLLAATSVPFLALRSTGVGDFTHDNFDLTLYPYPGNMGALAFLMVLKMRFFPAASEIATQIGPLRLSITRALILVTMAVPTLTGLWITFRRRPFDFLESLGLWTMVYFFVFREVWEYHYVLLLPVLVLFYAKARSRTLLWIYALAAVPTLFVFYDVAGPNPEAAWSAAAHVLNHGFKLIPLVWLFIWTAGGGLRRGARKMETVPDSGLSVAL